MKLHTITFRIFQLLICLLSLGMGIHLILNAIMGVPAVALQYYAVRDWSIFITLFVSGILFVTESIRVWLTHKRRTMNVVISALALISSIIMFLYLGWGWGYIATVAILFLCWASIDFSWIQKIAVKE